MVDLENMVMCVKKKVKKFDRSDYLKDNIYDCYTCHGFGAGVCPNYSPLKDLSSVSGDYR